MLSRCSSIWGSATILDSDPVAAVVHRVLYRPLSDHVFLDQDPNWGIYHGNGDLVQEAAYYRLPRKALIGQSQHIDPEAGADEAPAGPYVYGGPVIMHFGHFITAALPRLWQIAREGLPPNAKILCHSHQTPEDWFSREYVRTILGSFGLSPADFVQFSRPTVIRRLHVPRPSLEEQTFGHRVFRDLCKRVGIPFSPDATPKRQVYLSKSRHLNGTYRYVNEIEVDEVMAAHGVEVLYPETIAFPNQIRLLHESAVVLGSIGSAFHNSLFCQRPIRFIGLAYGPEINANYEIIDRLVNNDAAYVYPNGIGEEPPETATFSYSLDDPKAVALGLISMI